MLAEVLNESRPVPIDPQPSPISFDTASSSEPLPGPPDNAEPVTQTVAVASSTSVDGVRTQRARSLLTKLHHIFSLKLEPPSSDIENDPSPLTLPDRVGNVEPAARAVAVAPVRKRSKQAHCRLRPLLRLQPLSNRRLPCSDNPCIQLLPVGKKLESLRRKPISQTIWNRPQTSLQPAR